MKSLLGEVLFRHEIAKGGSRYEDHAPGDPNSLRIVIWARLGRAPQFQMILDTGAPWCILDPELLHEIGVSEIGLKRRLIVRSEEYEGRIIRAPLTLVAHEGEDLTIEASFFVPHLYEGERWPHPNFLGLGNALDKLRIALDPSDNSFYFGPLG